MTWDGLDQFRQALLALPETLAANGGRIVEGITNAAEREIRAGYPPSAESLRDHVVSDMTRTPFGAVGRVRNTSKLAFIYEHGSQARHYITRRGKRHLTGRMPPGHVFVPAAMRQRRKMYQQLKDMLTSMGFRVTGNA